MAQELRDLVPLITYADSLPILQATRRPHMRTLAPIDAVFLATIAHIRHAHTDYDDLLAEGYDHDAARHFVLDEINTVLREWGASRGVSEIDKEYTSD